MNMEIHNIDEILTGKILPKIPFARNFFGSTIGIFDSGLGGLIIARAIRKVMPEYDYVYLGDTKRVPYGNRSHEAVFEFTRECVDYLFRKENCAIVIVACNTASARALRKLQKEYLTPSPFGHSPLAGGEESIYYYLCI